MKLLHYLATAILGMTFANVDAQNCNINLAVLPMSQGEDVPAASEDYLLTRLSQMLTAEGITTDASQGQFFISAKFNHITVDVTPGPPAQTTLHTYLTLYMGDLASQTVYATSALELRGVGTSTQRAFINALKPINAKNAAINSFIERGTTKIVDYFNKNYRSIIAKAKRAAQKNDFQQALWHLVSIPECCVGYSEAYELEQKYYQTHIDRVGSKLYTAATAAWSANPNSTGAEEAFALLIQIDSESTAYPKAVALASEMKASVKSDRNFELREKYHDAIEIKKNRIDAIRQIGVAYGNGQQPATTNLMWLK